jgi:multicomponent Na+:H+ antiporter subunit F
MTIFAITLTEGAVTLGLGMAGVAMFLAFARLVLGPSLPALDLTGLIAVGIIAAYDILTRQPILLDAATVVALVSFLGTVAFARYVERRRQDD